MNNYNNNYTLPTQFVPILRKGGETGMGSTVIRVVTTDGKVFKNISVYNREKIIAVYGYDDIPFDVNQIQSVSVTHREDYPPDFKGFTVFGESVPK